MAKIAIVVEYQPNPKHYPDCATVEECVAFDVEALNELEMDPAEFLSSYDFEAKAVTE